MRGVHTVHFGRAVRVLEGCGHPPVLLVKVITFTSLHFSEVMITHKCTCMYCCKQFHSSLCRRKLNCGGAHVALYFEACCKCNDSALAHLLQQ